MTNLSSLALITPFPSFKGGLISKGISIESSVKLPNQKTVRQLGRLSKLPVGCAIKLFNGKKNQMAKLVKIHSADLTEMRMSSEITHLYRTL